MTMKISEVIKKLQEIKDEHGDCDVYRTFSDNGDVFSVDDDTIEFREGCVEIITYER